MAKKPKPGAKPPAAKAKQDTCLSCLIAPGEVVIGHRRLPGVDDPVKMLYCKDCAERYAPRCLHNFPPA